MSSSRFFAGCILVRPSLRKGTRQHRRFIAMSSSSSKDQSVRTTEVSDETNVVSIQEEARLLSSAFNSQLQLEEVNESSTLQTAADWILESHKILVLTGAGVSVSAGIPDFRTPGTGLYDNLQKYNLPYAEAVFDIDYYCHHSPQPFIQLAAELWPSEQDGPLPTLTHSFVALLEDKQQRLLRLYTQNIDGLEQQAGLSPNDKLVECHGHFRTARCTHCRIVADMNVVRQSIQRNLKVPLCAHCQHYVKPDIVFFGEQLPPRFHQLLPSDLVQADLLLVLGTSLQVPPVALIPDSVHCHRRILVNRELVGSFGAKDIFLQGDCDTTIQDLAERLGWLEDLHRHHEAVSADKSRLSTTKKMKSNSKIGDAVVIEKIQEQS